MPEEESVTVPIVPAPAAKVPFTSSVPAPTVILNVEPLPADEGFKLTAPAVSIIPTAPVEFAPTVAALVEPVPLTAMPPVPADNVSVGVVSALVTEIEPAPAGLEVIESEDGADKAVPTVTVEPLIDTGTPVNASVPAPAKVTVFPTPLLMAIEPTPLLEMVPVLPAPGPVTVRLLPLPFMEITELPVALMADVPAKVKAGELIVITPPPCTVCVAAEASVIPVVAEYVRPPAALMLIVPVPPKPSVELLLTVSAFAAADEVVTVPLSIKFAPLALIEIVLLEATVTLPFTVVSAELVVVTAPPFKLSVVVPAPADFEKVNACPAVGVIVIAPPVVDSVAEEASGEIILRGLAPPPEVTKTDEAETVEPAPRLMVGLAS